MNKTLAELEKEMNDANKTVQKLTKKLGLGAIQAAEYQTARKAWRAYWTAKDAETMANK